MFDDIIGSIAKQSMCAIDSVLKQELIKLGFRREFTETNLRQFISNHNIELLIENSPMLTTYKAIEKHSNIVLFSFCCKTSIYQENEVYIAKNEIILL